MKRLTKTRHYRKHNMENFNSNKSEYNLVKHSNDNPSGRVLLPVYCPELRMVDDIQET